MATKLLKTIAPNLTPPIDIKILYRHAAKGEKIGFPEVKKQYGIHKYYEEDEVQEWWTAWYELTEGYREGYRKRGEG